MILLHWALSVIAFSEPECLALVNEVSTPFKLRLFEIFRPNTTHPTTHIYQTIQEQIDPNLDNFFFIFQKTFEIY